MDSKQNAKGAMGRPSKMKGTTTAYRKRDVQAESPKDLFLKTVTADYKSVTGGSAFKNGVLSKIVSKIKTTYLDGDHAVNTLDELLTLSGQQNVSKAVKDWLEKEALPNNERITVTSWADGKFRYEYKPPLPCTTQQELLNLLREYREEAKGGIFEEDILASVPHGERVMKALAPHLHVTTRRDRKRIIFFDSDAFDTAALAPTTMISSSTELPSNSSKFDPIAELRRLKQNVSLSGYSDEKVEDVLLQKGLLPVFGSRSQVSQEHQQRQKKMNCESRDTSHRKLSSNFHFKNNEHVEDLERYEYDQPL